MPDAETVLWVVGKVVDKTGENWEFQGVFDTEEKAIAACYDDMCWVGPCALNRPVPEARVEWPGAWYPLVRVP